MDSTKVPQDDISTYANNKKAIYATDKEGRYTIIPSTGWQVEAEATTQAVQELERLAARAYGKVAKGEKSPLYFHMYDRRMDLQLLSESTGLFKWRIKRHFKPSVFSSLSRPLLERYGNALGISTEDLCRLPERETDNG